MITSGFCFSALIWSVLLGVPGEIFGISLQVIPDDALMGLLDRLIGENGLSAHSPTAGKPKQPEHNDRMQEQRVPVGRGRGPPRCDGSAVNALRESSALNI